VAELEANPALTYGGCVIDAADPLATAPNAKPVGSATSSGDFYQSIKGNELPQAPENKVAFNATYTMRFEPGNLIFSGSFIWKDKSYAEPFDRTFYEAPSWDQVDLRLTWSGDHDRYEIVAYVKNLFNSLGYDAAADGYYILAPQGGGGPNQANSYDLTPPRQYGLEFHYKF
jgi:iron complex outermembrane receptor protein